MIERVELWYSSDEEINERVQRRSIRDGSNVLGLSNKSFVNNFRLNKEAFLYVLNAIATELKCSQRSTAITPICKLSAALKFFGQGGYQHQIGQDVCVGLAQQTMSACLHEVCCAIEKALCPKHIKFNMQEDEEREAKRFFYEKSKIPGIIGVIDGTHIQMVRPTVNEHNYFNRKLKHSMNAMVICDHKMRIRAVDTRYGGSCHDSHVWQLSTEKEILMQRFNNGDKTTRILGDSGYPLQPWILTPYRNATDNSREALFNENFAKGRSIIERTYGVLKGRFRCLLSARELHYAPAKVIKIMNACCALHNICIEHNVEQPSQIFEEDDSSTSLNFPNISCSNIREAANVRDAIRDNMFTM